MKAYYLTKNGKISERNVSRHDLVKEFGLNIRDLRPVFSALQVTTILPRSKAIIVNFGFIKAVLSEHVAYFLQQHASATFDVFLQKLTEQYPKKENKKQSFHLFILEQILDAKMAQMTKKINDIDTRVTTILETVKKHLSVKGLENLLAIKKRTSRMEVRLKEILSAIQDVLDDDKSLLELTMLDTTAKKDTHEVESILENFLEQMEDKMGHLFRMKEDIEDTQEFMELKLSNMRTTVVRLDLIATMTTLILSFLAVIVGLFGTNIKNGLENSHIAFVVLSLTMIMFFIVSYMAILYLLKKREVL